MQNHKIVSSSESIFWAFVFNYNRTLSSLDWNPIFSIKHNQV